MILTKEQKESVKLLSLGTFLEYFDLMLYVHLAVLLNSLFFPEFDNHTRLLVDSFTFCITFIFRPVGAFIFGYAGDHMGRKFIIILTSILMAIACLTMAFLPTYAQIGITASYIMIGCRIIQSMSSIGELMGSLIYLTEIIKKKPEQYVIVSIIPIFSSLGGFGALFCANLIFSFDLSWRWCFGVGILIAFISIEARTKLKESNDYVNFKKHYLKKLKKENLKEKDIKILENDQLINPKLDWKMIISYFFIECPYPIFFFLSFIYSSQILKNNFGYTPQQIISHNFIISLISVLNYFLISCLNYKVYPLSLARIRLIIITSFSLFLPFLLNNVTTPFELMLIQGFLIFFIPTSSAGDSIIYSYIPIARRFTWISITFSLGRAITYPVTSYGMIYLIDYFGNYGILIIALPFLITNYFGLNYFINLEKKAGNLKFWN